MNQQETMASKVIQNALAVSRQYSRIALDQIRAPRHRNSDDSDLAEVLAKARAVMRTYQPGTLDQIRKARTAHE